MNTVAIRILAYIAAIFISGMYAHAYTTVNLPTSIVDATSNGGTSVVCSYSRLYVNTGAQGEFREVDLPEAMHRSWDVSTYYDGSYPTVVNFNLLIPHILDVEVSTDGRYVFVAEEGTDGLGRYDVASRTWLICNMPTPYDTEVRAVATIGDTLYAGTMYDGIFISSTSGETWTAMPMTAKLWNTVREGDTVEAQAIIAQICPTGNGSLIVTSVGSGIRGTYDVSATGLWRNVTTTRLKMCIAGSRAYGVTRDGILYMWTVEWPWIRSMRLLT